MTQAFQELLKKHLVKSKKETSDSNGAAVQFHVRNGDMTLNMPVRAGRVRVSDFVQALKAADLPSVDCRIMK